MRQHWDKVYTSIPPGEVSWYQPVPAVSLAFFEELGVAKDAAIIDVGGGDGLLADHLLEKGYSDITVLDISSAAVDRAKKRQGGKAGRVNWIVSDITEFVPGRQYDCWHDRAAFHFLTTKEQVAGYLSVAQKAIPQGGKIVIGTFSETGPSVCSGLPVKQYSESSLTGLVKKWFRKIKCLETDHITPFNTLQRYLFCSFKRINA